MLQAGVELVGGYRLVQSIGAGAFGVVWEAQDRTGATVALKFLDCRGKHRDLIASEIRVLRALSELRHPNIIRLLSVHAATRHLILVMEKADCNLADLHQAYKEEEGRNAPPRVILDLLGQAAEALDFLASLRLPGLSGGRGMQHCDVKPSNLLVLGDRIKVADFGLCAAMGGTGQGWRGTFPYAAPELYKGRPSVGTDQYALAMTFCETVMGGRPFWPDARKDDLSPTLPVDLAKLREREVNVLARALHPQPGMRYTTCTTFVDALRKAVTAPRPAKQGARLRLEGQPQPRV